jgi:hypothetical protein
LTIDMNNPIRPQWGIIGLALLASYWTSALAQTAPAEAAPVERFVVKAVRVEGNTLLPETKLSAIGARLVGSERTLGDLRQGAALVQQAYRDAGYGGVVAYIPEQELAEGTVIIRVVEGKLARVRRPSIATFNWPTRIRPSKSRWNSLQETSPPTSTPTWRWPKPTPSASC